MGRCCQKPFFDQKPVDLTRFHHIFNSFVCFVLSGAVIFHVFNNVRNFQKYCSVKKVSPQRTLGFFLAPHHISFKSVALGLTGSIVMHPITVVRFMWVAKHIITNDVHSLPKTMSLVKCGHSCYRDTTCVSFFYEPTLQKCYPSSRNIQKGNEHTTGAFSYYRNQISKEEECLKKGHHFAQIGNLCYRQSTTMKNWEDARRDCGKLGGTLFNIDSPEKHDFFVKVVRRETSGGPRFIGASRADASSEWIWTDGRNIEQFYWLPKEPDYVMFPQNCVQYGERDMKYLWDNTQCIIPKQYYCHFP